MQQGSAPEDDRTQRQEDEAHHDRDAPWCLWGRQAATARPSPSRRQLSRDHGPWTRLAIPTGPSHRRRKSPAEHATPGRVIGPGPSRRAAPIGRDRRHLAHVRLDGRTDQPSEWARDCRSTSSRSRYSCSVMSPRANRSASSPPPWAAAPPTLDGRGGGAGRPPRRRSGPHEQVADGHQPKPQPLMPLPYCHIISAPLPASPARRRLPGVTDDTTVAPRRSRGHATRHDAHGEGPARTGHRCPSIADEVDGPTTLADRSAASAPPGGPMPWWGGTRERAMTARGSCRPGPQPTDSLVERGWRTTWTSSVRHRSWSGWTGPRRLCVP